MAKVKSRKDYTIKVTHELLGDFYYNYHNQEAYWSKTNKTFFLFTKELKKVNKWKTKDHLTKIINNISSKLSKNESEVRLYLGTDYDSTGLPKTITDNILIRAKRSYLVIDKIFTTDEYDQAKEIVEELKPVIHEKSLKVVEYIENDKSDTSEFEKFYNQFTKDLRLYRDNYRKIRMIESSNIVEIRISDVSNNFRIVKIKKLEENN